MTFVLLLGIPVIYVQDPITLLGCRFQEGRGCATDRERGGGEARGSHLGPAGHLTQRQYNYPNLLRTHHLLHEAFPMLPVLLVPSLLLCPHSTQCLIRCFCRRQCPSLSPRRPGSVPNKMRELRQFPDPLWPYFDHLANREVTLGMGREVHSSFDIL